MNEEQGMTLSSRPDQHLLPPVRRHSCKVSLAAPPRAPERTPLSRARAFLGRMGRGTLKPVVIATDTRINVLAQIGGAKDKLQPLWEGVWAGEELTFGGRELMWSSALFRPGLGHLSCSGICPCIARQAGFVVEEVVKAPEQGQPR